MAADARTVVEDDVLSKPDTMAGPWACPAAARFLGAIPLEMPARA
jgi:hypothetical protein